MEEILRVNGRLESGNLKDLAFCRVKVHVPVLFLLLKFEEVFMKGICFRQGAYMHKCMAVSSAKSRTLDLTCSGRSLM